jgi:hypothetical protein
VVLRNDLSIILWVGLGIFFTVNFCFSFLMRENKFFSWVCFRSSSLISFMFRRFSACRVGFLDRHVFLREVFKFILWTADRGEELNVPWELKIEGLAKSFAFDLLIVEL